MTENEKYIILSDGTVYDGIGFGSNEEVLEYHGLNSDSILRDLRG